MGPLVVVPGWPPDVPEAGAEVAVTAAAPPRGRRPVPVGWMQPRRGTWVDEVARQVLAHPEPVLLAAYGLGCIVAAQLPPQAAERVRGALLVAPVDPARRGLLVDFTPVPHGPLPYPSILVSSTNDPACTARVAAAYARSWRSHLLRLQDAGQLDAARDPGGWPLGRLLLQWLAEAPAAAAPPAPGVAQNAARRSGVPA